MSTSFNQDFCTYLEYHLTRAFANSPDAGLNRLWCDGIAIPTMDSELFKENVASTHRINTLAWIGHDGQQQYIAAILLGPCALEKYKYDLSLTDCLPADSSPDWVSIDIENHTIELRLK